MLIRIDQSYVSNVSIFRVSFLYILCWSTLTVVLHNTSIAFCWWVYISTLSGSEFGSSLSSYLRLSLIYGWTSASNEQDAIEYRQSQSIHVKVNRLRNPYSSLVITPDLLPLLINSISEKYFIGRGFVTDFAMQMNRSPIIFNVSIDWSYEKSEFLQTILSVLSHGSNDSNNTLVPCSTPYSCSFTLLLYYPTAVFTSIGRTMIPGLPLAVSWILQPFSGLWSIVTYIENPAFIHSPPTRVISIYKKRRGRYKHCLSIIVKYFDKFINQPSPIRLRQHDFWACIWVV